MAKANIMIDNDKTRVTEWSFEVGDETGQHIHEYDYVVVPMLDGELKIVNHDGGRMMRRRLTCSFSQVL